MRPNRPEDGNGQSNQPLNDDDGGRCCCCCCCCRRRLCAVCKSCLLRRLENVPSCPTCGVQLQRSRLADQLRLDHGVQLLVYRAVPGLWHEELRRRRFFSDNHPLSKRLLSFSFLSFFLRPITELDDIEPSFTADYRVLSSFTANYRVLG